MMQNPEKEIGNLIDKASLSLICYIDGKVYPTTKAMLLSGNWKGSEYFAFPQIPFLTR